MTITRVGEGTVAKVASGDMVPGEPAGIVADDLLLCLTGSSDQVVPALDPASWTQIYVDTVVGISGPTGGAFWHRYADSAPDYTITHVGGGVSLAVVVAYRGCVISGDPIDAFLAQSTGITSLSILWEEVTPTYLNDGCLFVWHMAATGTNGPIRGIDPEPFTQLDEANGAMGLGYADGINSSGLTVLARSSLYTGTGKSIGGAILLKDVEGLTRQLDPERYCTSRLAPPTVGA